MRVRLFMETTAPSWSLHESSGKFRDNKYKSNKTVSASDSESEIIHPVSKG